MQFFEKSFFFIGLPFLFCGVSETIFAQSVLGVSAPYAVANKPAWFVVTGTDFPINLKPQLGMKFAVEPPYQCDQATRTSPLSATRYEFSCVFPKASDKVPVVIFNKTARSSTRLWKGDVQILEGDPKITGVVVHGTSQATGQLRVICPENNACLTLVEPWRQERELSIEVTGNYLPQSLQLNWGRCAQTTPLGNLFDKNLRTFRCINTIEQPSSTDEVNRMTILSSSRIEDAQVLLEVSIKLK